MVHESPYMKNFNWHHELTYTKIKQVAFEEMGRLTAIQNERSALQSINTSCSDCDCSFEQKWLWQKSLNVKWMKLTVCNFM